MAFSISLVVFDVITDGQSSTSVESIMTAIFARTSAVRFRSDSPLRYQSGDFQHIGESVWIGRIERLRDGTPSTVEQNASGEHIFRPRSPELVTTSQSTSYYAFDAKRGLLVYRDTSDIPYTILASYVRVAARQFGADISLEPRKVQRSISAWLEQFTSIDRVSVTYRHSQSPGNIAVDQALEVLNAERASQRVVAKEGSALSKAALLSCGNPIGEALDHLSQSSSNGRAVLFGHVALDRIKVDTSDPVERHLVEADDLNTITGMRSAFSRLLINLVQRQ